MAEGSGEEHFQDSYLLLRQLRNEMLIEFERLKGETGFLKQDLTEVRSRMEAADCAELQATGESAFSRNARHAQRKLTGT